MSRCPNPFLNIGNNTCLIQCPEMKKFELRNTNGQWACVYTPDPKHMVSLVPVGAVTTPATDLEGLRRADASAASAFIKEKDRFEKEIAKVYGNIDKTQKITDAFNDLQKAENVRDQSPSAYQAARTAYYTLVKGADWINEERQRISKAEVDPEVQKYKDAVAAANARTQEQQKTIDVVNGIKDKVLSLKDDFRYSVNTFSDQLEKVKIQLNMENRSREKERDNTWAWIDTILNVLLVAVLIYAVYTMVRRYFIARRPVVPTATIRIPTYTGQPV